MRTRRLIVFSGAGLSAESGLPTFRGDTGLWEEVPIHRVCHIDTWRQNFDAVHEFYDARRIAETKAQPNAAHRTIAAWQKAWPGRVLLFTQNIDRLLERAGCTDVVHLHGTIRGLNCQSCGASWEINGEAYDRRGCPTCGQKREVKPSIVFFGEQAPLYHELFQTCESLGSGDTALVVGTSGAVLPADRLFALSPAYSVLVNLEPATVMNEAAFSRRHYGPATEQLPALDSLLHERMD